MNGRMLKGYIFAILSAVIYGLMPLMAKFIYADGVNPMTLVFLRNFLALPSLAILAFLQEKTLKIPLKTLPIISILSLFGCAVTPILLFSSYNYMASGTATVFHFVYPTIVVLASVLFLKKKINRLGALSVVLCFVGIALFYDPKETVNLTGSLLSLGSGLTFAVYVLILSTFNSKEVKGFLFSFYVAAASSVITFIACIVSGSLALPSSAFGWGMCILFSTAITTGAVVLFQQGAFIIGGEKTSVLSTLEPITSVIVGVFVFNESLKTTTVFGCILVILASILIALSDLLSKKKLKAAETTENL